ncbi:hypothetical protein DOTSEDRAFT_71704 [Dothistroma septosporum NZE10]|uniref:C2H2-type domain-containing protein n=1 Tax=Dothistroma septosporum (strain NZE10 / CBS 128990) TaxID=675120 RepID=N1PKF3_DOTSN|nr:hypothetical protein DOTSEDRAFT_71704 [Dothistroma septosporum NZE10]
MFSTIASPGMSQPNPVVYFNGGGSSSASDSESSSLPTLSRQTSSLGSDSSSPFNSSVWSGVPGLGSPVWPQADFTLFADQDDFGWWPDLIPIEEGYVPWSRTYDSFNSSCGTSNQSFDQPPQVYVDQEFSSAFHTAQLAADLLYRDNAATASKLQSTKKMSISRTKLINKERKRHECPDCNKSCIRPSDLLRHMQDVHGLAEQYYQCEVQSCTYNTRRKDKMKEHCRKMHKHKKGVETFATVNAKEHAVDDRSPLAKRQKR